MARTGRGSLKNYDAKRDFARTPEPKGRVTRRPGWRFVVQKHAARRLHYDFRLELDGVLKSWAVTKGPSAAPSEKRLAVRTEDHPIDYGGFEGTIPKGAYGGGTVMLWDRGQWSPLGDPHEGLEKGKLHFTLDGARMKGEWVLIRMRADKSGRENWLLRKVDDDFTGTADDLVQTYTTSVETNRTMEAIAAGEASTRPRRTASATSGKSGSARKKKAPGKPPAFQKPQLATLVDQAPDGRTWLHEIKYDGYRALFAKAGGRVVAYTRNGNDWTDRFASVIGPIAALPADSLLIDGEVVALDANGRPDFGKLQNAFKNGDETPLSCFVFDLLSIDGEDLRKEPLRRRKERLAAVLRGVAGAGPLHYSEHIEGEGERVLNALCAEGYEGVVSKKADAPYRSGRSRTWLKTKCARRQEFVIGGWSPSTRRNGFASLLLGYYQGRSLIYAGRVGTGFDAEQREDLAARLRKIERKTPPFDSVPKSAARDARWAKPNLVAEVAFAEFTSDGLLRHPAFVGLREDKPAPEITRETPQAAGAETVTRAGVVISNPDRVQFPDTGVTKLDLATYYEAVADQILPHMARRLISLVRCPQGRGKKCFFQRHDSGSFPESIKRKAVTSSDGDKEEYLYIEDLTGLIACVQMGVLEFHGWGSRIDAVQRPDRLVFDLDPDEGLDFPDVRDAARDVRRRLAQDALTTFPMVTGGKGVHVVAPLNGGADWRAVKAYAKAVAEEMTQAEPDRFTATMSKAKRKGRIFIDYLRNERSATAIMPYSTRARPGAPLALPVSWSALDEIERADAFTLRGWNKRTSAQAWRGYFNVDQALPSD